MFWNSYPEPPRPLFLSLSRSLSFARARALSLSPPFSQNTVLLTLTSGVDRLTSNTLPKKNTRSLCPIRSPRRTQGGIRIRSRHKDAVSRGEEGVLDSAEKSLGDAGVSVCLLLQYLLQSCLRGDGG